MASAHDPIADLQQRMKQLEDFRKEAQEHLWALKFARAAFVTVIVAALAAIANLIWTLATLNASSRFQEQNVSRIERSIENLEKRLNTLIDRGFRPHPVMVFFQTGRLLSLKVDEVTIEGPGKLQRSLKLAKDVSVRIHDKDAKVEDLRKFIGESIRFMQGDEGEVVVIEAPGPKEL